MQDSFLRLESVTQFDCNDENNGVFRQTTLNQSRPVFQVSNSNVNIAQNER